MNEKLSIKKSTENTVQEFVVFQVGSILCGINIIGVGEINRHFEITTVPHAPPEARGILNLRGQIVTVLDLRKKFRFDSIPVNGAMRIIVVYGQGEKIGLLVDSVEDILHADTKEMEPAPSNVKGVTGSFFSGVLKTETQIVAIINVEEVLASNK